jgi:fructose/tagatose bisphosphate aldolase
MRILLDHAAENGYGIAAFNVNNMEQIQAIMETAEKTESPVIIQASRGERKFMKETYGMPVEEIQRGIKHGVRKINVDTDNRLAMTGAIRKVFASDPTEFDPRKYLAPATEAMKKVCIDRMTAFGQAGNAGKIKPLTCQEMVSFYKLTVGKK